LNILFDTLLHLENLGPNFGFVLFFCFQQKLKIQLQEGTQNTTNMGKPMQPEWKSKNWAQTFVSLWEKNLAFKFYYLLL
jgi:hypothetical protein